MKYKNNITWYWVGLSQMKHVNCNSFRKYKNCDKYIRKRTEFNKFNNLFWVLTKLRESQMAPRLPWSEECHYLILRLSIKETMKLWWVLDSLKMSLRFLLIVIRMEKSYISTCMKKENIAVLTFLCTQILPIIDFQEKKKHL